MKRRNLVLRILSLFILTITSVSAQNSLLWQISSPEGKTSYLFGTYHLVGSEYIEAHPKLRSAYTESSTIVVETVIDSTKFMEVAALAFMEGHTLWDYYDSTQYNAIDTKVQSVTGIPLNNLEQMKPVAIAILYALNIAQKEMATSELDFSGQPIDVYFASEGKKNNKEIVSLESMMDQMKMIYDSDPLEKQAKELLEMMEDSTVEDLSIDLLSYYQNEDLDGMMRLSEEAEDSYGDMSLLLDDRNENWMEKLLPLLDRGDSFIAVGALHLPGDKGLLKLLETSGYSLKAMH